MTALHVASLGGHMETVEALLEGGSALEAVDNVSVTFLSDTCHSTQLYFAVGLWGMDSMDVKFDGVFWVSVKLVDWKDPLPLCLCAQ